jgi:predicted aldo/keto reductase-like oxidoreductase
MIYRQLGKTGLHVSILGFGAMRLPISQANPDFAQAIALIRHAVENGINYFDVGTFYCHGYCEKAFGLATQDIAPAKLLICGKNSSHQSRNSDWLGQLKNSLALFQREYFDLYILHYLNLEHWDSHFLRNGTINLAREAKKQGLFRHLGFSSHDTPENVQRLIDTGVFEAVILPFNLLKREYEETMKYAHRQGLGVIVMNPLAGGALANANLYANGATPQTNPKAAAELALNFVLSQPFVHSVLSGMDSETVIDENIAIVHEKRLTPEEIIAVDQQISHEKAGRLVPCTGCNYCMPCVQGIDIPAAVKIWNEYGLLKGRKFFLRDYAALAAPPECCIQCDECIPKCPNQIAIPEVMEEAARLFSLV